VRLAFCWSHCRRYFYDCHQATASPIAFEALQQIGRLYVVEAQIRGRPAEARLAARREHSRPIVDALKTWLSAQLERISGKSSLAEAIRYALRHWDGLGLFLDDGRVELDTNTVERSIRPIVLGKKNSLFAGSDGGARHWAIAASLINTAKLHAVEPFAYLKDVLERVVTGRTKTHQLDNLLPWQWKATSIVNP
jgi:transposase